MQFFTSDFAIAKDLGEKPSSDSFATMNWHYSTAAVGMKKKMMTTLGTDDLKPQSLQRFD